MAQNILLEHQLLMKVEPSLDWTIQFAAYNAIGQLTETHWLPKQVWKDMGGPETITVTVQPGDAVKF